jgi:hypothetical protein
MNTRLLFKRALLSAIAPAAFALAASQPADAKIVILGNDPQGWEFSTDGSVNGFLVNDHPEAAPALPAIPGYSREGGTIGSGSGTTVDTNSASTRFRTGLLPTVFGFNVKSPDLDGIRVGSRLGIYPQIQNGGGIGGPGTSYNAFGSQIDLREAFFTVDAKWGQLLVGRELDQFLGDNILADMTIFGVGATGGSVGGGGTTLGRIGYGYVYPNFNSQVRYTTPDFGGFKASVGLYDPAHVQGNTLTNINVPTSLIGAAPTASINSLPRIEGAQDYVTKFGGTAVTLFASEMWQEAKFVTGTLGQGGVALGGKTVDVWGIGGGAKVSFGSSLDLVLNGYGGQGLGTTLLLDANSLDGVGEARDHSGYYVQGVYHFGQGTSVGFSYGGDYASESAHDKANRVAGVGSQLESQELFVAQIYHDVNKYFRLIGEFGHTTNGWFDGATQADNTFSVGAFVFW